MGGPLKITSSYTKKNYSFNLQKARVLPALLTCLSVGMFALFPPSLPLLEKTTHRYTFSMGSKYLKLRIERYVSNGRVPFLFIGSKERCSTQLRMSPTLLRT